MVEDLAHVFFHCPFAVQTWQVAGLWHTVMTEIQQSISAEAAIFSLLQTLHNELQQRFAAVLWSLWKHRNNKLWQNENETAAQVIFRAQNLMEGWVSVNTTSTHSSVSHGSRADQHRQSVQANACVWQKPQQGRFKCNIDAAFSSVWNRNGIGVCLRDDNGTYVLAQTRRFPTQLAVDVGEAMGLFHAIQWLTDMKFDNVDFVTDSKVTAEAFNSPRNDVMEFGT